MTRIGAHVGIGGGVHNAPYNAKKIGATAFAMFTANPRQWTYHSLPQDEVDAFGEACEQCGYQPQHIVPHINYLCNLGHPNPQNREKSFRAFLAECTRCEQLGLPWVNIHPGAHPGEKEHEPCLERIAEAINQVHRETDTITVLLENTAGQGTGVGSSFEQLARIIEMINVRRRVGVCYDTCHGFAAGYDIRTHTEYQRTFERLDELIGLNKLKAFHLNDAKRELNSHVDRHHSLGKGEIGWDAFRFIMTDKRFDEIPMILETIDDALWPEEIRTLKELSVTRQR